MNFFDLGNIHLYIAIALSLFNAYLLSSVSFKFFHSIQVCGYHIKFYFNWLKDTKGKYVSRLLMLSFLSACCIMVTNILFFEFLLDQYLAYLGLIFYLYWKPLFS